MPSCQFPPPAASVDGPCQPACHAGLGHHPDRHAGAADQGNGQRPKAVTRMKETLRHDDCEKKMPVTPPHEDRKRELSASLSVLRFIHLCTIQKSFTMTETIC